MEGVSMAKASEQVGRTRKSSMRKSIRAAKLNSRRLFRRLSKMQGDEAPRKHFYRGYFD